MYLFVKQSSIHDVTIAKAVTGQVNVDGPFTVSPDPIKKIWIWERGGFKVQPHKDYYVKAGRRVLIKTRSVDRHFNWKKTHTWWMSNDSKNWHQVENNNSDITVQIPKDPAVHDIFYQLVDTYSNNKTRNALSAIGRFGNNESTISYNSQVAHIHIISKEKPVTKIKVKLDNNYIGNNDFFGKSANATAVVNPTSESDRVCWTLGELNQKSTNPTFENELATIDEFGSITAKDNAEGEVSVTGYIANKKGKIISDTKKLKIGRGLEDRTGRVGQGVTFRIETGELNEQDDDFKEPEVRWYSVINNNTSNEIKADKDNPLELTISDLKEMDDGKQYFAIIDYNNHHFQTRDATLHVLPAIDPPVHLKTELKNLTYTDENNLSQFKLNNVSPGDRVQYTFNIQNDGIKDLKDSNLTICLENIANVPEVKLDDMIVDQVVFDDKQKKLEIPISELKQKQEHVITVLTTIADFQEKTNLSFNPTLSGLHDEETDSDYNIKGDKITVNYTPNKIQAEFTPIKFHPIAALEKDNIKRRTAETNSPNPIAKIKDTRRKRGKIKVTVIQETNFVNEQKDILDANLMLFNSDTNPQSLVLGKKILITSTDQGETLKSIYWKESQGLLLHLGKNFSKSGQYKAGLAWSIEDVPEN